jgi:hypothetical protein
MIDTTLAARAAGYIAGNLIGRQLLVATDREGYELALSLAAAAGPDVDQAVRERLGPLVEHSIEVGQEPPEGWLQVERPAYDQNEQDELAWCIECGQACGHAGHRHASGDHGEIVCEQCGVTLDSTT